MNAPKYARPLDAKVARWVDGLDDDALEFFQERAGIREHDGGLPRAQAEAAAWAETVDYLKRRPLSAITPANSQADRK